MKGVLLAGGLGTRLAPLTKITNKHLLPVYNKPMVLYPLDTLRYSGVTEIIIVCGRIHAGDFMNYLGSGREHGVKLSYALQDRDNGGIADAMRYAEDFADGGPIAVILGDNLFEATFRSAVHSFERGARLFLKKVSAPERYGVAVFDRGGTLIRIEEKPKRPKSEFAQTGFYIFDANVFDVIRKLKPSARGELELTDISNTYLSRGELDYEIIRGRWFDAGTFDSLLEASRSIARRRI